MYVIQHMGRESFEKHNDACLLRQPGEDERRRVDKLSSFDSRNGMIGWRRSYRENGLVRFRFSYLHQAHSIRVYANRLLLRATDARRQQGVVRDFALLLPSFAVCSVYLYASMHISCYFFFLLMWVCWLSVNFSLFSPFVCFLKS